MADFDDTDGPDPDDLDALDDDPDADELVLDEDFDFGEDLDPGDLDDDLADDLSGELDEELAGLGLEDLDDGDDTDGPEESLDELAEADSDADPTGDEVVGREGPTTALVEDADDLLDELDPDTSEAARDLDVDDEVREGEFVCRSCFMAKRESALADEENLLCRDCV